MMKKNIFAALFGAAVILNSTAAMAEEDRYIVILKEAPAILMLDENDGVIDYVDNIFVVDSMKAAYSLAPADNVKSIFADEKATLFDLAPVIEPYPQGADDPYFADQWHMSFLDIPSAWSKGFDGSGVKVAVIDSGMDLSHPDLPAPVSYYNAMSGADTTDVNDILGHGTAVTGLIAAKTNNARYSSGIAHGADIISIKITNSLTEFNTSYILMGFQKALNYGCDVINMSFGFTSTAAPYTTIAMGDLVKKASDKGVIMVAAAGNEGATVYGGEYQYPASYDEVVSVGSIGDYSNHTGVNMEFSKLEVPALGSNGSYSYTTIFPDAPSYFTQHNDKITCAAPGYRIQSTSLNSSVARRNGTSFASPIVASIAALAKQINPSLTSPEFIQALQATSDDIFTEGYDIYTGYGKPNIEKLISYIEGNYTPLPTSEPTFTPEPEITPTPTPSPEPTSTPEPENSISKNGNFYTVQTVYGELDSDARVLVAIYEDSKLTGVKSTAVTKGSAGTKVYFDYEGEADYVQIFVWAFDENGKLSMLPLSEKYTVYSK